jgi:MFS family permease
VSQPGRIGILRPLKIRDFRLLWTGLAVSLIGDGIYLVAIAWEVYQISGDPKALALVGIAWTLPLTILLLLSGVLSDRLPRRRLMLSADAIRFVAIGAMGWLTVTGGVRLWHLVALAALYGVGEALFGPANTAIVPDLVPSDLLVQANSLGQFVRPFAATLLGPAVGGMLVGRVGAGWAFVADAGTFAFSALMIFLMHEQPSARDPEATTTHWRDLVEGFRFVRSRTWLWASMSVATLSLMCFWGPFEVLVPYLVKNDLHGSAFQLGLVFAAGGAASIAAAALIGQRGSPRRPFTIMYWAWAIGTFSLVGFAVARSLMPMYLVSAVSQSAFTVLIVLWFTVLQRLVPSQMLGRVSSLDWFVSSAGVPASFALTGPIAAALGARTTLALAGTVGAAVIVLTLLLVPAIRSPERDGSLRADAGAFDEVPDRDLGPGAPPG